VEYRSDNSLYVKVKASGAMTRDCAVKLKFHETSFQLARILARMFEENAT